MHPRALFASGCLFVALVMLGAASGARAQTFEGTIFRVGVPIDDPLALAPNGDVAIATFSYSVTSFARYRDGVPPELAHEVVEDYGLGFHGAVSGLASGGWVVATSRLAGDQRLDVTVSIRRPDGNLRSGIVVAAAQRFADHVGVTGLISGFAVAWRDGDAEQTRIRIYEDDGTPRTPALLMGPAPLNASYQLRSLPDGGFVAAWASDLAETRIATVDAVGTRRATFTLATDVVGHHLAVSADGTRAVVAGVPRDGGTANPGTHVQVFAPDGSFFGADVVLPAAGGVRFERQAGVAFDAAGGILVLFDGVPGLWAARFDGNGTLLGPPRRLQVGTPSQGIHLVRRRQGGFFALYTVRQTSQQEASYGGFLSLCEPGTSVCGDGTLAPLCEVCDAGAGNDDATPDACRTTCTLPRCGDGVVDAGEACDDDNRAGCDGCDEFCGVEIGATCGDAILGPPGCGEECDDGDDDLGDGCTTTCEVERVLGGGSLTTDCLAVWQVDNPANVPRYEKVGISRKQRCTDGDPVCDFDGAANGSCTFHAAVCANNEVSLTCSPAILRSWTLRTPSATKALTRPDLAAVRAAFTAVVPASIVGTAVANRCSPMAAVPLPLRDAAGSYRASKLVLKSLADTYDGRKDTDSLALRCDPAP